MAKSLMIQGTCSNAGKSLLVTGLCRIFRDMGYSVSPFKAQNMALNSFVTREGLEMGRAQVTQSYAAGKEPDIRMNPVLLKPSSDTGSQVIVMGKAIGTLNFIDYKALKKKLKENIHNAYYSLAAENDIIILEGAGSPAEVNLIKDDLVNMRAAEMANAPVLIAGDIDRGGVFASFYGTYKILNGKDRRRIKGYIINKFRGDASLLSPALYYMKKKTGRPVLGTVPYIKDLKIPDEDSVNFKKSVGRNNFNPAKPINIALVDLPHISNFTDFDPFYQDDDVNLYIVNGPGEIKKADIIILPGSKNVIGDLTYLKTKKIDTVLLKCASLKKMIIGICGGYQMLGNNICDPSNLESSSSEINGLGLLSLNTVLEKEKMLKQTKALCIQNKMPLTGYEIHHGKTNINEKSYIQNSEGISIGARKDMIWGTYLHGIFDNGSFRREILNEIRKNKSLPALPAVNEISLDSEILRLSNILNESLDMKKIYKIMGL